MNTHTVPPTADHNIDRGRLATLPEQVAEVLAQRLRGGDVRPGPRLNPVALAQEHGVSHRTDSRALTILSRQGLATIQASRGAYVLAAVLAVALAGCATMKNTPAQERAQAAWDACNAEGRIPRGLQVIRIESDGRLWFRGSSDGTIGYGEVHACLSEKRRAVR